MKTLLKKILYTRATRPWGGYEVIEQKDGYWVKKLFVTRGEQTSLQSHAEREEVWIVLQGEILATHGTAQSSLSVGEVLRVGRGEKHRLHGITDSVVLEVAFGNPREEDIIRYEDDYGRVPKRDI